MGRCSISWSTDSLAVITDSADVVPSHGGGVVVIITPSGPWPYRSANCLQPPQLYCYAAAGAGRPRASSICTDHMVRSREEMGWSGGAAGGRERGGKCCVATNRSRHSTSAPCIIKREVHAHTHRDTGTRVYLMLLVLPRADSRKNTPIDCQ